MSQLLDRLLSLDGTAVYVVVGLLVLTEDALFVGFVVPGETAAVLGGVDAARGHVALVAMAAVVTLAAAAGDSIGYEVGRRLGPRALRARPLRRRGDRVERARAFLARRGGPAVFGARFVAFLRAFMPALAGAAHLRYRTFLPFNAAGALVWGTGCVLLGYLAGNSYQVVERTVGRSTALVVAGLAVVAIVAGRLRRRRRAGADQARAAS